MSYAQFLLVFLVPPILILCCCLRRRLSRPFWLAVALVVLLALCYTGPWDDHLIAAGVWRYPRQQVSGLRIGRVPLEEYLFYVLQVTLGALLTLSLLGRDELGRDETAADD